MKKYISFSGGVESRTMAILFGRGAILLFVDTGSEHNELYKSLDEFERFIVEFHKGECNLLKLKHPNGSLKDEILRKKFMPNPQTRYCTYHHKIKIIDDFLKNQGECELMIGLNADEDRTGNLSTLKNVQYTYPLKNEMPNFMDGMGREDCEDLLKLYGVHPSFPPYMSRGGCKFCFFKSVKEYKAMYHLNRAEFDEVAQLEKDIQDKRTTFFAIESNGNTMQKIAHEAYQESMFFPNMDFKDLYVEAKKKHYCGLFCHR